MSFNRQYREPWPRAAGAVLVLLLAATGSIVAQVGDESLYRKEIDAWRKNRLDRLTAEDGWLTLVGLFWLQEGANRMGSDPTDTVVFPQDKAPAAVGNILLKGNELWLEVEPDVEILHSGEPVGRMRLRPDSQEDPTILESGDLTFFIIERDGRFAVRMKDKNHPPRHEFEGIDSYPVESRWRITGRFAAYDPPKKLPIPTVLGTVSHQTAWGKVLFDVDGQQLSLDAVAEPGAERLFLIFADETTGVETYGGGRYLYADAPNHDGEVILDFNKAYNPPCVFTPYATCPLPPRPNRLRVRIEAGEKKLH